MLSEILGYLFKQRKVSDEQGKVNNCIHHDVDTLCISILEVLLQTVLMLLDKDTKIIVSFKAKENLKNINFVVSGLFSRLHAWDITVVGRVSL